MNKNTLYNNILPSGGHTKPVLPRWFFYREHSPTNFHSDYIENKTTLVEAEKSMYKNTIPFIRTSACNVYPTTSDLNRNGIAKTISREDCLYTER